MIIGTPLSLQPFDDAILFAKQYPARFRAVTRTEYTARKPALAQALAVEAGTQAAKPWGGWSLDPAANERARKMYFYLIREGLIQTDGSHYLRTHELSQGYVIDLLFEGAGAVIAVSNKANRAYKFTKGDRQIPGAAKTGWLKDKPIIQAWVRDYTAAVVAGARDVKAATT